MSQLSNVVYLHGAPQRVGHYLRVGSSGHRQLETLLGSGDAAMESFVIEASSVSDQQDLISLLRNEGRELILDTKVAELSALGKFDGYAKHAPWADHRAPLNVRSFAEPRAVRELVGSIARFAIKHRFNAVLAPSHYISGAGDPWFTLDQAFARELRAALDREGGRHVGVDYNLIWSYESLREVEQRSAIAEQLRDTEFDNLWVRTSGIGSSMTAVGVGRYIEAVAALVGRPLVADQLSGLAGLSAAAFGVVGGLSHGVCEKERFDASDWSKPRTNGGGGREHRILVAALDKLLTFEQVEKIMTAPHGRRYLSCASVECCPKGLDDMMADPKRHYLRQRVAQITGLSRIPDAMRVTHFRKEMLAEAARRANLAAKLEIADEALQKALAMNAKRLDKMQAVLEKLSEVSDDLNRSPEPVVRRPPRDRSMRGGR